MSVDSCTDEDRSSVHVKFHLRMHTRKTDRRRTLNIFEDLSSLADDSITGRRHLSRWSNSPSPSIYYTVRSSSLNTSSRPAYHGPKPSHRPLRRTHQTVPFDGLLSLTKLIAYLRIKATILPSKNFNDRIRQASEKYARFLQPSLSKRCRPLEPSLRPIVLMTNILRQLLLNQTSYTTSSEQSLQVQSTSLLNDQQQNCKNEVGSISTTIEESCSKGSDFNNDVEMDYDENSTNAPLQTASETCQLSDVRSAVSEPPNCEKPQNLNSQISPLKSNKKFFAKQDPNSTNKSRQINIQSSLTTGTEESFRESISQRLRSRRKLKSQK